MDMIQTLVQRRIGRRWTRAGGTENWWTIPVLADEIDRRIADGRGSGVAGLLRSVVGDDVLARGVSVGAGSGGKERNLLRTGMVEHFTLYELAEGRAQAARDAAEAEGLSDRQTSVVGNAFEEAAEPRFDLVYWDHALHHMMDVDAALAWSVAVLRPGGVLLMSDYIGPKRLQFPRSQVERARDFLREHEKVLGDVSREVWFRNPVSHLRQFVRDASEAPESELIEAAWAKNVGSGLRRIGGQLIHLCAPPIARAVGREHPVYRDLIEADAALADSEGGSHFAAGIWQKPR